jgi:hypothetical protein
MILSPTDGLCTWSGSVPISACHGSLKYIEQLAPWTEATVPLPHGLLLPGGQRCLDPGVPTVLRRFAENQAV